MRNETAYTSLWSDGISRGYTTTTTTTLLSSSTFRSCRDTLLLLLSPFASSTEREKVSGRRMKERKKAKGSLGL